MAQSEHTHVVIDHEVPGVDASDSLILQDGEESVETGSVLSSLRALTTELHPVLHQVQWLHKHCCTHPVDRQVSVQKDRWVDRQTEICGQTHRQVDGQTDRRMDRDR